MNNLSFISKRLSVKAGMGNRGAELGECGEWGWECEEFTIIHKTFETNSSFHVKQRTTGKV